MQGTYKSKTEVFEKAKTILGKTLREVISEESANLVTGQISNHGTRRKGLLGNMIETYFFHISPGNSSGPDFDTAGVELKTTPLKADKKKIYVAKERLVFSMINYDTVVAETWEKSSFLKKNKTLLLMFYLWGQDQNVLDYQFKSVYLLDLLDDVSDEDVLQIRKDWEYIVDKIRRNEAHLLSEGDTYYLGACTKAADSSVTRIQSRNGIAAKPRAFSLKQQYINYLIQTRLLGKQASTDSIFKKQRGVMSIEEAIKSITSPYLGMTDQQIQSKVKSNLKPEAKNYKWSLVKRILGVNTGKIIELEKSNVTLKVVTLEHNGRLEESISFPAFKYKELINEEWVNPAGEVSASFHSELETKRFLFFVFQKEKNGNSVVLKKVLFWNFPMEDIGKAKDVWAETIELVKKGRIVKEIKRLKSGKLKRITYFPGTTYNGVAHVRPHGENKDDVDELPVADGETGAVNYTKHCFWLNARYVQKAIEGTKGLA